MTDVLSPSYVPLVRFAEQIGYAPGAMKKSLARAGLPYHRVRINGRQVFAVTKEDADSFIEGKTTSGVLIEPRYLAAPEIGGVYLIRPDPEVRPNRIKIGWTDNFDARLKMHRCIAPELEVLCLWCTSYEWMERMALNLTACLPGTINVSGEVLDVVDFRAVVSGLSDCFQSQGVGLMSL